MLIVLFKNVKMLGYASDWFKNNIVLLWFILFKNFYDLEQLLRGQLHTNETLHKKFEKL